MNSDPETTPPAATTSLPDLARVLLVISNLSRWQMLRELATGETRTTSELAQAGDCSYDSAIKHLVVMRAAGLVEQGRGSLYQLPRQFLPAPGQAAVDFGHCLLRFNVGK